jgi:hypothetical protein
MPTMRKEYDFARLTKAEPKYLRRAKAAITTRLDPPVIDLELEALKG